MDIETIGFLETATLEILTKEIVQFDQLNTLSKYPGGHPILRWELKLNLKNSAGKY